MNKVIIIKSPIRSIRPTDKDHEILAKQNQNFTNLWNIINNQAQRIKELENNRNIEYVKSEDDIITVKTSQGNKRIKVETSNE